MKFDDRLGPTLGEKTAKALEQAFGMRTVADLVLFPPRRYATRGELTDLHRLNDGDDVTVMAQIAEVTSRPLRQRRGSILDVRVTDGTASLHLTFFNQSWRERQLTPGRQGFFSGKVSSFRGARQLTHPEYVLLPDGINESDAEAAETFARSIVPVYPATAKLPSWRIGRTISYVLDLLDDLPESIPAEVRARRELGTLREALEGLHRPESLAQARQAGTRLAWEEAFTLQGVMVRRRRESMTQTARARIARGDLGARFDGQLPFTLTPGQLRLGEQIAADLAAQQPMHRLLQGEVGSGKTVVALRAMLQVVDAGGQAVLLAPTEVLAQQHYRTIRNLLGPLGRRGELDGDPNGTQVVLLTGSTPAARKRQALLDIGVGDAGIVVGTHALLEERVQFFDLGLVVVDEQHRFGVEQRAVLGTKGRDDARPHILVMTATPIPRTAAITVFGDLEVSTLSELPAGRAPIASHVVLQDNVRAMQRMWERAREEVQQGHQVYVVCPRITAEDADDDGPAAAEAVATQLANGELREVRVGLLHGRMAPDEKDEVMRRFLSPQHSDGIDVLVATTIIEVGVDVPNASMMVILDADRFGISQLHQLRGRVGRGNIAGLCLLQSRQPADSPAVERLQAVAGTLDGFALAELDLQQRGEGDILGVLQSGGRSSLRLLSVLNDSEIIAAARDEVLAIFEQDPTLAAHPGFAAAIARREEQAATEYLEKA